MITRQTIKQLQKKVEAMSQENDRPLFCLVGEGGYHFNNKTYKTEQDLLDGEQLKSTHKIIFISTAAAEKYGISQTIR